MEALIKKLREQGISVTPQRMAVLRAIMERHDHPSAESIYQEVRKTLPMISFNTVYKTLETFCQKGLIFKINPLHEVARYDGNLRPHAHLICRRCQKVEDVAWEWPSETPLPHPRPSDSVCRSGGQGCGLGMAFGDALAGESRGTF